MKLVNENIKDYKQPLFRCGWCGAPTNSQGVNLEGQDFDDAVERIAKGEEAIQTPGNCCRADAQGHEELMRQAMEDEYLGESNKNITMKAKSIDESLNELMDWKQDPQFAMDFAGEMEGLEAQLHEQDPVAWGNWEKETGQAWRDEGVEDWMTFYAKEAMDGLMWKTQLKGLLGIKESVNEMRVVDKGMYVDEEYMEEVLTSIIHGNMGFFGGVGEEGQVRDAFEERIMDDPELSKILSGGLKRRVPARMMGKRLYKLMVDKGLANYGDVIAEEGLNEYGYEDSVKRYQEGLMKKLEALEDNKFKMNLGPDHKGATELRELNLAGYILLKDENVDGDRIWILEKIK